MAQQQLDKIVLVSSMELDAVFFYPEEYQTLKDFYQKIVDTQTAMVVLKKVEESTDQE